VSPAFGSWGQTTDADRIKAVTTRINTAMTSKATAVSSTIQTILNRQYVYGPIQAVTINGTVKGQLRGWESHTSMDAVSAIGLRVVKPDLSNRGVLLAITAGATEYVTGATTHTNRFTPASTALTEVVASDGDYLVIEIGCSETATATNRLVQQIFGDDHATNDLAENETAVAAHNPWVELSTNLSIYVPPFKAAWAKGCNTVIMGG